jgi:hypothetical protein
LELRRKNRVNLQNVYNNLLADTTWTQRRVVCHAHRRSFRGYNCSSADKATGAARAVSLFNSHILFILTHFNLLSLVICDALMMARRGRNM